MTSSDTVFLPRDAL